jgi:hypothetical protein
MDFSYSLGFLFGLLFDPVDRSDMLLRNMGLTPKLHGATTQKTAVFTVMAEGILNLYIQRSSFLERNAVGCWRALEYQSSVLLANQWSNCSIKFAGDV